MDDERARSLIEAKTAELQALLEDTERAGDEDRETSQETGDANDPAPGFESEAVDDAVASGIRERLAALERASARLADGSYGHSIRSGAPIPDERLEIDPAAELTVEEASADEA